MVPPGRHFCLPRACHTVNTLLHSLKLLPLLLHCMLFNGLACNSAAQNQLKPAAKLAIIIDDIGYKLEEGSQAVNMEEAVTISIIPFSPYDKSLARLAHQNNKEVMLHAPMMPMHTQSWEWGLNSAMNKTELVSAFTEMLAHVPHTIGVNNHGGSLFTQDKMRMTWLMNTLKQHNLFFIDSRTTADSTGIEVAIETGIPYSKRDLFLDNELTETAVRNQLDRLVEIATERGSAIAIGHPHKVTLDTLQKYFLTFKQNNIELVSASKLLRHNNQYANTFPGFVHAFKR